MAIWNGTSGNDVVDWSSQPLGSGQTGHAMYGDAGNDRITGHAFINTLIQGGQGDDVITGQGGADILLGDDSAGVTGGNDTMYGGAGQDLLFGGAGNDFLYGMTGAGDLVRGGRGDDTYRVNINADGTDFINDDKSASGSTGFGGGTDTLQITSDSLYDLYVQKNGDDLWVSNATSADSVIIEDFFLGGDNVVENLSGNDYMADMSFLQTVALVDGNWYDFI